MSASFIPADETLARELDEKLSRLPFRDKDTLVQMYNSGLINRKAPQVAELVDELIVAYKGIEKRADGITFLDGGEIAADELISRAEAYRFVLRLQRIVKDAATAGLVSDSSYIFVANNATVAVLGEESAEGESTKDQSISAEKLPKIDDVVIGYVGQLLRVSDFAFDSPFEATKVLAVHSAPVTDALEVIIN